MKKEDKKKQETRKEGGRTGEREREGGRGEGNMGQAPGVKEAGSRTACFVCKRPGRWWYPRP